MTWIEVVTPEEAEGTVEDVYEDMRAAWGRVSPAFSVMSPHPAYLRAMWDLHQAVMAEGRLTATQKETLALAVSAANGCRFCLWAHGNRLRSLGVDDGTVDALTKDPLSADLDAKERALVAWAVKVTEGPADLTQEDLDRVRAAGWDDESLLEAGAVVGHLNHLNRTLDAFGVGPPENP